MAAELKRGREEEEQGERAAPPAKQQRTLSPLGEEHLHYVNVLRCLAADMPSAANSGHPGAPMGCAPMAYVLFLRHMRFDPTDPLWPNRDRFVLSNGHACALQYSLLHLVGYDLSLNELKNFRQLGSRTPGHPERGMTPGVEVTTGPLGQGFANAVGMAIASSHLSAVYNKDQYTLIDNYTYVIMGDGCAMEGVVAEAASLAGHLRLGRLIVLYDDNKITIDGSTNLAFTENVLARFESYGWHTQVVEKGDTDLQAIDHAISEAKRETSRPSLIAVRTTIGYLSSKQGTHSVHGSPLTQPDLQQVKKICGLDPNLTFQVPADVAAEFASAGKPGRVQHERWKALFTAYENDHPHEAAEFSRRMKGEFPAGCFDGLPVYSPDTHKPNATRELSGEVLNFFAKKLPELVGGCSDLSPSTKTELACSFDYQANSPAGRHIRFGVREHAMCAIMNGLHAFGGLVPFGATFLVFLTYCLPSVRLAALSKHQTMYIFTHDSIGLGEDGPTHQPVEVLQMARAIPSLNVIRPADGNEVVGAYLSALKRRDGPTLLALTRHNVPHLQHSSADGVLRGAYTVYSVQSPQVILVASGSEVSIAIDAAKLFGSANVVSMPCFSIYDEQDSEYKLSLFPVGVPVMSVEASIAMGWEKYAHAHVCMGGFGASAKMGDLFKLFGFTSDNICAKLKEVVAHFGSSAPSLHQRMVFSHTASHH